MENCNNELDLTHLNHSQRLAVEFPIDNDKPKHLLVLAGAGSGKTRVITHRTAYLVSKGVSPDKIQILSFTKKAAAEIANRATALNVGDSKEVNGSTFHAWCMHIMKKYASFFDCSSFTVIDQDDQLSLMKLVCGKDVQTVNETKLNPAQLLDIYSFARNTKKTLTETLRLKLFEDEMDESYVKEKINECKPYFISIYKSYEEKKLERGYLDYDDIISIVIHTLKTNSGAADIITPQFEHILVDEMQDTNPMQWELLSCFINSSSLFCVGDDAQSIYAFRGADFKNIHSFTERVPNSTILKLEDNYRSKQEILDLSNWLLEKSPLNYNKKLNGVRGSDNNSKPILKEFGGDWEEATWIVRDMVKDMGESGRVYEDYMVLSRTNFGLRKIEAKLLSDKIPYRIYGGISLLASAHIRDMLSLMRIVGNHKDEIAWMRFLQLWDSIGYVSASKIIAETSKCENFSQCVQYLTMENISVQKDKRLVDTLRAVNHSETPLEVIESAMDSMENMFMVKYAKDWSKRLLDFDALKKLSEDYSNISEFINEYILNPSFLEANINSKKEEGVILSTVHSAKGLESAVVYVINVSMGVYPSIKSIARGEEEIEEDRRVLYVALTRAKDKLVITRKPISYFGKDGGDYYFLQEIKSSLLNKGMKDYPISKIGKTSSTKHYGFGMDFN